MRINDLKPVFLHIPIQKVDEKLYRGCAIFSPLKLIRLKNKGITQVIDLRGEQTFLSRLAKNLESAYCKMFNVKYMQAPYQPDFYKLPKIDYFKRINKFIETSSSPSYVHCNHGKHRTTFVVAMYKKYKNVPTKDIINELNKEDWQVKGLGDLLTNNLKMFINKFLLNTK